MMTFPSEGYGAMYWDLFLEQSRDEQSARNDRFNTAMELAERAEKAGVVDISREHRSPESAEEIPF